MPTYDLIMLFVLGSATLFGAIKGFAWQVASLGSIFVSYFVAYYFRNDVAKMVNAQPPWNLFLAMLILYAGSSFAIWMIFRLISGAIDQFRLKEFDRHMGALLGFLKGIAYCLLITMFAMTLLGADKQTAICDSRSGYFMSRILSSASGLLPKEVDQIIGPHLARLEQKLETGRSEQGNWNNQEGLDPSATNPNGTGNWGWENPAADPSNFSNQNSFQPAPFDRSSSLPANNQPFLPSR